MDKKVMILDFSPRNSGNCANIAQKISEIYNRTNVHVFKIDADNFAPCHDCNYECLTPEAVCPVRTDTQMQIMRAATESDLIYFIVPNFCGYPNAAYFAFNERSVGFFNMDRVLTKQYMSVPKRFIIVSNTENENFRNAMQQQTSEEPKMLYLKTGRYKRRSTAGDLMDCEEAVNDLRVFIEEDL